jgi:hypothetical protein
VIFSLISAARQGKSWGEGKVRLVVPESAIWYKAAAFQANTIVLLLTTHTYRHMQQGARTHSFFGIGNGLLRGVSGGSTHSGDIQWLK